MQYKGSDIAGIYLLDVRPISSTCLPTSTRSRFDLKKYRLSTFLIMIFFLVSYYATYSISHNRIIMTILLTNSISPLMSIFCQRTSSF